MDIELARTFVEIVSTGSFIKAADRLHVAQTTVSARVRLLEQQLGDLFSFGIKVARHSPRPASNSFASLRLSCSCGSERGSRWRCLKGIAPY